jgi:integrase/recombinase XerC
MDEEALVTRYLEFQRVERRLAARTLDLYQGDLVKLSHNAAQAGVALTAVQSSHIRRWVAQMHSGGRSGRGIALILSGWRVFYAWLGREGLVEANPVLDVRAPKSGKPLPKALGVDEAVQLAEFSDESDDPWLEARDAAMVELMYGGGLRVAELTGLDVQAGPQARGWVDLQAGEAHVLGKGSKRRTVPIGAQAVRALRAWLAVRGTAATLNPALFLGRHGTRLTSQSVWQRLRCTRTCCGIPSPATCCSPAVICAACRNCWGTPTSARRRSTRGWTSSTWPGPTTRPIRGPSARAAIKRLRAQAARPAPGRRR